ncbi:MAG: hypothetical protein WC250_03375 [Candidatus Paceibacterota bacterium]|jgi:hypothetical protein
MRYVLQIFLNLFDLFLIGVSAWNIYNANYDLCMIGMVFCLVVVWNAQGGFMVWRPSNVRQFMKNARAAGL